MEKFFSSYNWNINFQMSQQISLKSVISLMEEKLAPTYLEQKVQHIFYAFCLNNPDFMVIQTREKISYRER